MHVRAHLHISLPLPQAAADEDEQLARSALLLPETPTTPSSAALFAPFTAGAQQQAAQQLVAPSSTPAAQVAANVHADQRSGAAARTWWPNQGLRGRRPWWQVGQQGRWRLASARRQARGLGPAPGAAAPWTSRPRCDLCAGRGRAA
jgi:hypothetical protein